MSKKQEKVTEKVISENLPTEERWLMQPTNITFLRGDITPKQWGMMIELMDALQFRIAEALKKSSSSLFAKEEYDNTDRVYVHVPLKAVTENAQYYRYVEEIASSFMQLYVPVEKKSQDGQTYIELNHVVDKIRIPKSSSGPDVKKYRKGYIEFVITKEQAETLFSLNPNNISQSPYHKYLKSAAKNAKSFYTSRIYVFLTAYRKFGRWTPLYSELHKILGFTKYNGVTNEWEVIKYPVYRQFKQKVLNGAQAELKELAERGEVDCYFDYEEIYPIGTHRGTPEKIRFTIHTTGYGHQHDEQVAQNRILIDIEGILRNDFECTTSDVKQVMALVTSDNAELCMVKMKEIKLYIDGHKDKIDNIKKYAIMSIKNALVDTVEKVEEAEMANGKASGRVEMADGNTVRNMVDKDEEERLGWERLLCSLERDMVGKKKDVRKDYDNTIRRMKERGYVVIDGRVVKEKKESKL